jgi:lipopolysaccharide transport system permease protein
MIDSEVLSSRPGNISSPTYPQQKPDVVIQPSRGVLHLDLRAVWQYRELLYFLIWRDIKVRYKQTVIGTSWAILQPLMTMAIFTVVFGNFANIPSDGLPYPLFAYTALLPWTYFAKAVGGSGTSLVSSSNLIGKIYFPRLIIPLAAVAAPLVDFLPSFLILLGLMIWFGVAPTWGVLALPLLLVLALSTALAVGLFLSALNVRFRDVGHTIPFLIQVWMYASPVAYPVSLVPEGWRHVYGLNPMAGVVEGFRWALLGTEGPDVGVMTASAVVVLALCLGGLVYFRRMERTFADII